MRLSQLPSNIQTPSPDLSAAILIKHILAKEPFAFVRYGDGAIECMHSLGAGRTCDQELYSPALGAELAIAWDMFMRKTYLTNVYVGDWRTASFSGPEDPSRYALQYEALLNGYSPRFLHFETLLLMRRSTVLVDFYKAIKEDERKKLFIGPSGNADAAKMLDAYFLEVPLHNLYRHVDTVAEALKEYNAEIVMWGAGMAGTIPVARMFQMAPFNTYINLGSAMDPLFRGRSRKQQISEQEARELFKDLL